jgi:amino acid permease
MMSFGAIVGVGWITILGQWLLQAGPGGTVIALGLGAVAILLVTSNYGLLARKDLLSSGGEIGAIALSLGAGPQFVTTAALALACLSIVAFEAVSAGWIIVTIWPAAEGPALYSAFGHDVHAGTVAIALVGLCIIAALNLRSLSDAASAQQAVVLLKVVIAGVFCVAGVLRGTRENLMPLFPAGEAGTVTAGVLAIAATMPLWYAGFNVTALLAGERDASVSAGAVGQVMKASVLASSLFYMAVVLAASSVVPWPSLISASLPAAAAFREGLGSALLADLVLIAGLLGVVSAWIACFAGSTRVLTALRRQLSRGEARGRLDGAPLAPTRTTVVVVALISIALSLNGRAALVPIVNVAALCYGLVYLLVSCAAWKHSTRAGERVVAVLGVIVSAFMSAYVIYSALETQGLRSPEILVIVGWTALWGALWGIRLKRLKS